MVDGRFRPMGGASTQADTSKASGPTGPHPGGILVLILPLAVSIVGLLETGREVSRRRNGSRGLPLSRFETLARGDFRTRAGNGHSSQHHGFHGDYGHGRPPAI